MLLNLMAFTAVCMIGFVKTGVGEAFIKHAAKGVVREIVQDELKKQLPALPKVPDKKWWEHV